MAVDSIVNPTPDVVRWPMKWHPIFLVITVIGMSFGAILGVPSFLTVRQYRTLDLSRVSGLTIRRLDRDEESVADAVPRGPDVQFSDVAAARTALTLLAGCKSISHQHDTLYDGYLLEINIDRAPSLLALRVYKKSTMKGSRQVVMPQYAGFTGGEYECPEIQQWVNENIDPLYSRF
ncbi:MAG TPA: hypothetical protein VGO43_02835 [Pyrinomonadaceae bacterium]|nr:hypothetical protein [Pyrinomonadaceae bacterium]